jgi:hypothetical protein
MYKFGKNKKSQISMEFLMTMGLLSIIFISALIINNSRRQGVDEYKEMMDMKAPCDKVTSMISNVYAMGHGSKIMSSIDYDMTLLGQTRQVLIWAKKDDKNLTYFCFYMPYNVTNAYNTSFKIPRFTDFTVANFFGSVEIYNHILTDNLVLWLRMDEYNKIYSIKDWSNKMHNVEINDVDCSIAGFRGGGCKFSHENASIMVTDFNNYSYDWTISLWVNIENDNDRMNLLISDINETVANDKWGYIDLFNGGNSNIRFNNTNTNELSSQINKEEWVHIAYTANTSNLVLYINGVLNKSIGLNYPINLDSLIIGSAFDSGIAKSFYESYFNYIDLSDGQIIR